MLPVPLVYDGPWLHKGKFGGRGILVGDLKEAVRGTGNDPGTSYVPGTGGHTRGSDGVPELSFEEAKLCASSRSLSPSVCPSSLEQKLCSVVRRVWAWGLLSLGLVAASWSPFGTSPCSAVQVQECHVSIIVLDTSTDYFLNPHHQP